MVDKQTILFFNSMPFWGGGEKLHLEYAEAFLNKGYRVILFIAKDSPLDKRAVDSRFIKEYISIGKFSFLNPFTIYLLSLKVKKYSPGFIVFSASQDMKAASLAGAGISSLVYLRGLAVSVKNNYFNRMFFYKYITHFAMNSLETERCTLGNFDRSRIPGLVKVIYHGIDLEEYHPDRFSNEKFRGGFDGVIIGNAGRLTSQKAQIDLIHAAVYLKKKNLNFKILIAGSGELMGDLLIAIKQYQVEDRVNLAGFVRDMPAFLAGIDIFVLSSHWEGFGYVLVESMALAKPVIAYRISSNPELIEDGLNGFLCNLGGRQLAEKIEKLILDEELRRRMGKNGRKIAEERFEIHHRVDEFELFIRQKVAGVQKARAKQAALKSPDNSKGQRRNYQR